MGKSGEENTNGESEAGDVYNEEADVVDPGETTEAGYVEVGCCLVILGGLWEWHLFYCKHI